MRFADQKNQFRVQMGQATLMRYSGLSRSSIKRAVKDLLASKLIVLIEQGGVTPDGLNTSNLYQLMVPAEGRKRSPLRADRGPGGGSAADPLPGPDRTRGGVESGPRPRPRLGPARGPINRGRGGPPVNPNSETELKTSTSDRPISR